MRIVNNVMSISAQRHIAKSQFGLSKTFERLSSGLRVNRAGDDAAGLAISEKLRANIRALQQASRNASDGVALIQTAEGAMDEITAMLIRMKELAEQAATGTISSTERGYLNQEYQALRSEITRIADSTKFNETSLLDGTLDIDIQIGISNGTSDTINVTVDDMDATALGLTEDISTVDNARSALEDIDTAITTVSSQRASLGALQNRLESIISNYSNVVENLTNAESGIRDADIATETANMTKYSILLQAGIAVLTQANQIPAFTLSLLR